MTKMMTSLTRVLTTLQHKEPDKIPLFLFLSMYGAKELGMSIKEYYSKPEYVAKGQLNIREKYHNDCVYTLYYIAIEFEAWGGKVVFRDKEAPNAGEPIIKRCQQIETLTVPEIKDTPCLVKVLKTTEILKEKVGHEVPVIGVVISPFSLPIMQMGFDKYIQLLYEEDNLFKILMKKNEAHCIKWANAQIEAGATAIIYIDPVSSPMIIPKQLYKETGFEIAQRTIAKINGPVITHFGSSGCMSIVEDVMKTKTVGIGTTELEDIGSIKRKCKGKICITGNLNEIEMCRWDKAAAEKNLKEIIAKAGHGGGLIITNSQAEIPWQVSEEILSHISEVVRKWGKYPLDWID